MRKTAIAGMAVVAVLFALAPAVRAQGSGRSGTDVLMLRGFGSAIGVTIRELRADELSAANIESGGAVIETVRQGSPAERAGFRPGDIVVEFDGETVRGVRSFSRLVSETPPGRTVSAVVVRDGQRQTLQVTPEESRLTFDLPELRDLPEISERLERRLRELPRVFSFSLPRGFVTGARLGIRVTPLSDQLASYFGVSDGVLVTTVEEGSAAAQAGVRAGDVLTSVNGRSVRSARDIMAALRDVDAGATVELKVTRDKQALTLQARLPDRREPARRRPAANETPI